MWKRFYINTKKHPILFYNSARGWKTVLKKVIFGSVRKNNWKMHDMFPLSINEKHLNPENALQKCMFVFFIQESFARAKNWVKELQRQASPNIVIALAGNKADLANKRALDFQVCDVWTDASCWLYKWDVERFINKQTCHADFQSLRTVRLASETLTFFWFTGCTVICRWQQFALYGNIGKDFNEREWDFYGHW